MVTSDRLDMMSLLVRIADTGSLAEASRTLGLSQPVASRMMRRLEALVGSELVHRSTRGLTLTEAGEHLVETAREMLGQWSDLTESLSETPDSLSGTIRIGVPVVLGQSLLPAILAVFIKRHPGIVVECELFDAAVDLPSRGYDLQIRAGPVHQQSTVVRDLWTVRRAVVARADHPPVSHPRLLGDHPAVRVSTFVPPIVSLSRGSGESVSVRLNSVFVVDNFYAALGAVRAGLGFAIFPCFATQQLIDEGELKDLCPGWLPPPISLSLTQSRGRARSHKVEALIRFLHEAFTAEGGLGLRHLHETGAGETIAIAGGTLL